MRTVIDKLNETAYIEKFYYDMKKTYGCEHIVVLASKGDNLAFHYNKNCNDAFIMILEKSLEYLKSLPK